MAGSKVQNHQELKRWIEEGRTYSWISEQYLTKYNIEFSVSGVSEYRRRHGLSRRQARDRDLIPWDVRPEHDNRYILAMLRTEASIREGFEPSQAYVRRLENWRERLEEGDLVVHYDPDTDEGFFLIPREPQDDDIIRHPRNLNR